MELGNHQSYLLRPVHKQDLIELVVLSNPKIPHEEEIAAISITNELISDVKTFIDELMKEIMTSVVKKFPVKCYFLVHSVTDSMLQWRKLYRQAQFFALQLTNMLICQNITSCLHPVSYHIPSLAIVCSQ